MSGVSSAKRRQMDLWRRYGLTEAEWDKLWREQDGHCPICLRDDQPLVVEHNHATLAVRALTCQQCNLMLGHARDQADVLRRAADYLERTA